MADPAGKGHRREQAVARGIGEWRNEGELLSPPVDQGKMPIEEVMANEGHRLVIDPFRNGAVQHATAGGRRAGEVEMVLRSEERRGGKGGGRTGKCWVRADH